MMRLYPILIAGLLLSTPLLAEETVPQQDIYTEKCSRCHKLPEAGKRTLSEWKLVLDVMQQIMLHKKVPVLNDVEKEQVLTHLKQHARQPAPEKLSMAEQTFSARCTLCHQLPEPSMLKPKQWELIMNVMQQRMQQASVPQLAEQEFDLVLKYLQQRARN